MPRVCDRDRVSAGEIEAAVKGHISQQEQVKADIPARHRQQPATDEHNPVPEPTGIFPGPGHEQTDPGRRQEHARTHVCSAEGNRPQAQDYRHVWH